MAGRLIHQATEHDKYHAESPRYATGQDPVKRSFMNRELPQAEDSVAKLLLQDKDGEIDENNTLRMKGSKLEKPILKLRGTTIEDGSLGDQERAKHVELLDDLPQLTEDVNDREESMSQPIVENNGFDDDSPQCKDLDVDKKSNSFYPQIHESEDWGKNPPHAGIHESNTCHQKQGKYFYYEKPLYEDTGCWIPVSVPPMSESEHDEWSKGFFSNGGYIPEGDLGWSQLEGEDKELTMWDVVADMLLAARGKVNALASGDIHTISWISSHLIEQAWREMAQTLTEANFGNTQEILESEPPKWLPDSAATACMLCSVRFHPILCTRHHCRFCGGIFCGDCSKGRSLLPEKFRVADPQRVCDVCCVRLESVQPYLMDQVSRAAQLPTHDLTDLSTLRSWVNFPWGQSMEHEIYKATNAIRGYNKV